MKFFRRSLVALGALLFLSEVGLRLVGLGSFPIYQVDSEIGYIPAPNQSGNFLNKNDWHLNDKSMGVPENFESTEKTDLLVIGDSLVHGGNPYRHRDKLGSQLQKKLGEDFHIWPVGAPSWGFLNEKEYLDRHAEVLVGIDGIVWVFNSGDFQDRSQWWTDATHPRTRPLYLSYYVLNKYLLEGNGALRFPGLFFWVKSPAPPSTKPIDGEFESFVNELEALKNSHLRVKLVVLYPDKNETENRSHDFYESLEQRLKSLLEEEGWSFLSLRESPQWNASLYRDFIHPTPEGNRVLAKIIAEALQEKSN
jgi:lysophospholipase L1-like esterase